MENYTPHIVNCKTRPTIPFWGSENLNKSFSELFRIIEEDMKTKSNIKVGNCLIYGTGNPITVVLEEDYYKEL